MTKNKKGSTLVSVIVSFAILMIALAMFSQTVSISLKLMSLAESRKQSNTNVVNAYCLSLDSERIPDVTCKLKTPQNKEYSIDVKVSRVIPEEGKNQSIYYFDEKESGE